MQHTTDTRERRFSSELTEDGVLPPELFVDDVDEPAVAEAIVAALQEHPNAVDGPVLQRYKGGNAALVFHFAPQELPVMADDGTHEGWLPPYRAEEQVREAIIAELPEDWGLETERTGRLLLYEH